VYSCAQQGRLEGPIPRSTTPRAPRYLSDPNPPPRVSRPRPKCEMVIGRKRDALVSMPSFSRHQLVTFSPEKQFPPPSCNLAALHVPPPTSLAATSPTSHTHRITPPAPTRTLSPESHSLYQPHHPQPTHPIPHHTPRFFPLSPQTKTTTQNVSPNFHLPSSQAGFAVDHPEEVVLPRRQGRRRRCCQASDRQARRQRE
jgi:hypothetical protein